MAIYTLRDTEGRVLGSLRWDALKRPDSVVINHRAFVSVGRPLFEEYLEVAAVNINILVTPKVAP